MEHYDLIVVGDYYLDLIFSGLPQFPELGKEIVGSGFDMLPGGAYNSAVAMHRLGLKVGWAADFGDDDFSRFAAEHARTEGLDDALFVYHKRPLRRITVSASYPDDRAFITYCDPKPGIPAALKALATSSARVLYLPGLYHGSLFNAGLMIVRAKRMKLIMDGNSAADETLADPGVRQAIQSVDVFLPNAREARRFTGRDDLEEAMTVLGNLCPLVVVKDGANGAYARLDRQVTHAPAIPIAPLDTTGAGDCFNAGFITAWLEGRPIEDCLRWGNIVGGLSTMARGGTGRVVTRQDVESWPRQ
jgi:sugar/nucleoside kinase (ribokinase family)